VRAFKRAIFVSSGCRDPSAARPLKCAGLRRDDKLGRSKNRNSEPPRPLADRVKKRSLKRQPEKRGKQERTLTSQGPARVPSQEFALADGTRRPPLQRQTQKKDSSLAPERVSCRREAAGYLAACFLCRSVQTDTAELGSTALSPPSIWRMMPSLSMTMLARRAHS
jgi:hypothetical protein